MTATAVKIEMPSMEERIATMLKAPESVSAQDFALMLRWVDAKIVLVKRDASEALAHSLDPTNVDYPSALGKAHDAEHQLKRLENSKAALEPHFKASTRREELERWQTSTADLRQRVTELSQELLGTYSEAVAKLVNLFRRIDVVDQEVARVNHGAPGIVHRLYGVEAMLTNGSDTRVLPKIKLPVLSVDGRALPDAWPPPAPNVGLEYALAVAAGIRGARPMSEDEKIAESARVVAYNEEMERGRLKLNEKAALKAREHEVEQRQAGG